MPQNSTHRSNTEASLGQLRGKEFPNRVFNDLPSVVRQLEVGLPRVAANTEGLRSLTAWHWIALTSLDLKAH